MSPIRAATPFLHISSRDVTDATLGEPPPTLVSVQVGMSATM